MKITKNSPAALIRKNENRAGYQLCEVSDGSPIFSRTGEYLNFSSIAAARKFANQNGHKIVWD